MKGIIFLLTLFVVTAPAFADVDIVCTVTGPNEVTVGFTTSGETELVRMISLDVQVNDPNAWIEDVNCVSEGYYIHPGSISVDANGNVDDLGSCAGVLDANLVTSEQGSLYVGAANQPAEGDLFIVTLGGCTLEDPNEVTVTVSENALRGGVVMEDANGPSDVNLSDASASFLIGECPSDVCPCLGDIGGPMGLIPDGTVNIIDLNIIVGEMLAVYPTGDLLGMYDLCPPLCPLPPVYKCGDVVGILGLVPDGTINIIDLNIIVGTMIAMYPTGDTTGMYDIGCPF